MDEKFLKAVNLFKEKTEKECYGIEVVNETPSILDDKIGGTPYIPVGEKYPTDKDGNPLALLLQVNLKNIDLKGYPKKGILEIYTDSKVDYPCQYAVRYFQEGLDYQTDLPKIDLSNYIVSQSYKISLTKVKCHMSLNDYRFIKTFASVVSEVYGTKVNNYADLDDLFFEDFEWYDELFKCIDNPRISIGGYADFTQEDPRGDMKKDLAECLFKLDSCYNYNVFSIGDSGILFALISQKDIEDCNFSNALVDWDCC